MNRTKLCIVGACGRLGKSIIQESVDNFEIVGAVEHSSSNFLDKSLEDLGIIDSDIKITSSSNLSSAISNADVIISATIPDSELINAPVYVKNNKKVIIGTTGFSDKQYSQLVSILDKKIPSIVFTHHPLFLDNANEGPMEPEWAPSPPGKAAGYWTIPNPTRSELIDLFWRGNVKVVFAGHWHRNNYARNGKMEMITSGPVGYPLGEDPSGYRLVKINNTQISHSYHKLNQ